MEEMKTKNYHHFADKHLLIPLEPDEEEDIKCRACEKPIVVGLFHGCLSCNFFLHDHCINIPRSLLHPCHPAHPLTLVPTPTYPSGAFICNACGSEGNGFSFGCATCEFDLHFHCALLLPAKVKIHHLHKHEINLTFFNFIQDQDKNAIFECDVCHGAVDDGLWRYYCSECDFGAHLDCVEVDDDEMKVHQQTAKVEGDDQINGKSGTAIEAVQESSGETVDDTENSLRNFTNEMLEHQLAVAQLQHQMTLTAAMASVMRYY